MRRQISIPLVALAGVPLLASPAAADSTINVDRGGPARTVSFKARHDGEAIIRFKASAPGVSWATPFKESAVVSVSVDGRRVTDLLVPTSSAIDRSLALGAVRRGKHKVTFKFTRGNVRRVKLSHPRVNESRDPALRYAPVVVGRALLDPNQNAYTDAPLIAWHETTPAPTPGHKFYEYSVVWSNEDGGTDSPALMARWGRTTDIEWIYRVEVDAKGNRVDSGVYQAANHATLKFTGKYQGTHPILQTCTLNNNMCDAVSSNATLRFFLDTTSTKPTDRAREVVMDRQPWTYQIMAQEMIREGKIENPSTPTTKAVGDQRTYLFIEFAKTTGTPTGTGSGPGVALGIRLKNDPTLYRSDHDEPTWSIERDIPAATTVELPAGTKASDIASIEAIRRPLGTGDNGAPATVTSINRGFFLDKSYLPTPSTITWKGSFTLTPQSPTAILWRP
jgi:hypothetical protein